MSEVIEKKIKCAGGMPAFVAAPAADVKVPIIILLHERYGFTEQHFSGLARRLAREGYVCIAPDCFYKHPDQEALHRGEVTYEMTDAESVRYLDSSVAALKDLPQADASKIAVMGVCQTGRHPIVYAAQRPIKAALVWYGGAQPREFEVSHRYPEPLELIMAKIECPVLGHFGEADHIISINDVQRVRNALERHRKSFTIRLYKEGPHGWLNDEMPGRYRPALADQALRDQRAFLEEVLSSDYDASQVIQRYEATFSTGYDFSKNKRQA